MSQERQLMWLIEHNQVVILVGQTGSGKTTRELNNLKQEVVNLLVYILRASTIFVGDGMGNKTVLNMLYSTA